MAATPETESNGADEAGQRSPPAHLLEGATEALLFAADGPMKLARIDEWLGSPGQSAVHDALLAIRDRLRRGPGGIRLVEVAKGWQLRTDPRFGQWVAAMRGGRPVRLSRAALDTLSIVAYRQPCVRSEVEQLRGVDCGGVLRMLVERGLVQVTGRTSDPGRPLLYGTTPSFLELFDSATCQTFRHFETFGSSSGMTAGWARVSSPNPMSPSRRPTRTVTHRIRCQLPATPLLRLPPDPGGPEDEGTQPES